jgi:hypothetical protein
MASEYEWAASPPSDGLLNLDRAADRFDRAGEFDQESVAGRLDLSTFVRREHGSEDRLVLRPEP